MRRRSLLLLSRRWRPLACRRRRPTVDEALKYTPVQEGVEYDSPTADEAKACRISAEKIDGATGWVVRGVDGAILRQFVDSNTDNIVDTWSYFRGGLEVYRDIDANFNRKADQYRWFHTGGSRWGLDQNEDGKIDAWKTHQRRGSGRGSRRRPAHEGRGPVRPAAADARTRSAKLGLPKALAEQLTAAARRGAEDVRRRSRAAARSTPRPSSPTSAASAPAPSRPARAAARKDLLVYEDVWCMVLAGDQHQQLQLGSMVQRRRRLEADRRPRVRRRRAGDRRLLLRRRGRRPAGRPRSPRSTSRPRKCRRFSKRSEARRPARRGRRRQEAGAQRPAGRPAGAARRPSPRPGRARAVAQATGRHDQLRRAGRQLSRGPRAARRSSKTKLQGRQGRARTCSRTSSSAACRPRGA